MGEAVANVARRINTAMEDGSDTLDLSDCNLISFPDGVLKMIRSRADKIQKITLTNNKLKNLGDKFFTMFTSLTDLDLQGNTLTKLPHAFGEMQHLISINLSDNNFSVFPEQLMSVNTLQNINMSANQISEVPWERVCAMSALSVLDLRSNPLTSSPHTSLKFTLLT
ncbi:leucine-rich repeat-containing protein 20 [Neoarius graeffei]|uniref:leucine-rich repeat-containing protein 20 n=1 Tax=Neoarius graeffei TaxID=443677 RepID=UPI00298CF0D5|nr:leucine-rich repeat-containing protein 20 [Neoarius graeffei]XP_060795104.1 leucine-rich repeat-containing protein 20 [Neoarius graeffei]XP_060795105.1 leucine-rich repeat-containing protein 20 [Neoarius graeffei]XP_060795106.1 leucine-rich repeat-containing protein 20 [Neoarius graeffei]XP_060795107.1 leucine-rich repeat-containing protein 20 [Neoarius graeffei]